MKRPLPELADIIAAAGRRFMDRPPAWFTWLHLKVLVAIERRRTAAMGGHLDQCSGCGHRAISYNSCRNRHCPKCQSQARDRWLAARRAELLATPYAHVVFTLPHQFKVTFRWRDSAHQNKKRLLTLPVDEFLRRFLLHVLPRGFVRIRHFGFLPSRRRGSLLPLCKQLLPADSATTANSAFTYPAAPSQPVPLWTCPLCGGPMVVIERLTAVSDQTSSSPGSPSCLRC